MKVQNLMTDYMFWRNFLTTGRKKVIKFDIAVLKYMFLAISLQKYGCCYLKFFRWRQKDRRGKIFKCQGNSANLNLKIDLPECFSNKTFPYLFNKFIPCFSPLLYIISLMQHEAERSLSVINARSRLHCKRRHLYLRYWDATLMWLGYDGDIISTLHIVEQFC